MQLTMLTNPELRRFLWTEITPARLLSALAVIIMIGWAQYLLGLRVTNIVSTYLFLAIFCAIIGSYRIISTLQDEINERTWIQQRLASISPWSLMWGRIAGASSFWIYCALLALLLANVYDLAEFVRVAKSNLVWSNKTSLDSLLIICFIPFILSLGYSFGLLLIANLSSAIKSRSSLIFIFFMLVFLYSGVMMELTEAKTTFFKLVLGYHCNYIVHLLVFTLWLILAGYRQISGYLAYKLLPWAMPAFAIFISGWSLGYSDYSILHWYFFMPALTFFCILLSVVGLLQRPTNSLLFKRIIKSYQQNFSATNSQSPITQTTSFGDKLANFLLIVPDWLMLTGLLIVSLILFSLFWPFIELPKQQNNHFSIALPILWVFVLTYLRDLIIYIFWTYHNGSRALLSFLITLLILDGLLPIILGEIFGANFKMFFAPIQLGGVDGSVVAYSLLVFFALVHLLIAAAIFYYWRIKRQSALSVELNVNKITG